LVNPSARTAAPFLGALVVASLIDGLLRHRLFVDLAHVPVLAMGQLQLDLSALVLLYRISLGLFGA